MSEVVVRPDYESIASWCQRTGMSPAAVYVKLQSGDLAAIKFGRKTLIDVQAGLAWLGAQPRWKPSTPVQKSPRHKSADQQVAAA